MRWYLPFMLYLDTLNLYAMNGKKWANEGIKDCDKDTGKESGPKAWQYKSTHELGDKH